MNMKLESFQDMKQAVDRLENSEKACLLLDGVLAIELPDARISRVNTGGGRLALLSIHIISMKYPVTVTVEGGYVFAAESNHFRLSEDDFNRALKVASGVLHELIDAFDSIEVAA